MIICADGRIPEISRILALDGAKMIIDLLNLTSSADDVKDFTNPQYEYYINARAFENKVWFAVCSKMGVEDNCVCNLGRSMVVNPNGEYVSQLASEEEDILYCHVDLIQDFGKPLKRNPELYTIITHENKNLPVVQYMNEAIVPSKSQFFTSSVQFKAENLAEYEEKSKRYITMNSYCDGNIVFLPQTIFCTQPQELYNAVSKYIKDEIIIAAGKESDDQKYALALDKKLLFTRASENKIYLVRNSVAEEDSTTIVNPDGKVSAVSIKGAEQIICAYTLPLLSASKGVVPGTDVVMGRFGSLYDRLTRK